MCVREITRLKYYQAHLFLHMASLRCRVVCEMRRDPDLQSHCDQLTRLLLAMLHYSLTVAPSLSNRNGCTYLALKASPHAVLQVLMEA